MKVIGTPIGLSLWWNAMESWGVQTNWDPSDHGALISMVGLG